MGDPDIDTRHPVLVHDEGRNRLLTMHRPDVRNAFDASLYRGLASELSRASEDDDVHAVVLTGTPPAFSSGQDLQELGAIAAGDLSGDGGGSGFEVLLDAVVGFDKPLLAAVNGVAVGIGFTLLLHCDLVVVGRSARLRLPFAPLGVAPEAASSLLLARRIGRQQANRLLLTGDWFRADEAVAHGLALDIVEDDDVVPSTMALAARVAGAPLPSLRAIVRTTRAAEADDIAVARARENDAFRTLLQGWTRPAAE